MKVSKEDLKYDAQEFLRKLEWKSYFHENPRERDEDEHPQLRIPSRKHPDNYSSPLYDEVRSKLLGFVNNLDPAEPTSNLSNAEKRGKSWVMKSINDGKIFITKADKGVATYSRL